VILCGISPSRISVYARSIHRRTVDTHVCGYFSTYPPPYDGLWFQEAATQSRPFLNDTRADIRQGDAFDFSGQQSADCRKYRKL
jgi:hypothetical protein